MAKAEVLLQLRESVAHNGQIEAWRADMRAFDDLKTDHEDELRRVRGEAYQVATWYAVFQGVIFTAVSQANRLSCQLWWSPVSLSIAVSVAAFLAIADKLYSIGEVKEDIKETGSNISAIVSCLDKVDELGSALDLQAVQPHHQYKRNVCAGFRYIGSIDGISALLFLISFSIIIACFCKTALCRDCSPCSS